MEHDLQTLVGAHDAPLAHRVRGAGETPPQGAPCLVLLHGVGANEAGLIDVARRLDSRLVVILARGPLVFGPGQFGWFQVCFTGAGPAIHAEQAEQSRQVLVDFIDRLPALYGIDPHKVWIAGFSQGGIMSASVGLTRPDKVAGFGLLSGRILPEIGPQIAPEEQLRGLQAFMSHGIHDGKLGIDFARNARRLLEEKQVPLTYQEYEAGHELNEAMQRDFGNWLTGQIEALR